MQLQHHKVFGILGKYRMFVLVAVFTIFWTVERSVFRCSRSNLNDKIICVESDADENRTGLEEVGIPRGVELSSVQQPCITHSLVARAPLLHSTEKQSIEQCQKTSDRSYRKAHGRFWSGDTHQVRTKHHVYLNHESRILDIGGNVGEDAANFINSYGAKTYIILEPMKYLHRKLQLKFRENKNVTIYNIGLAKRNAKYYVDITGHQGDATSMFQSSADVGTCSLKTVNASEFYIKIGLGCYELDLVTINCEGCEFDVLENILETDIVKYFKHIQFATHMKLSNIENAVFRYCRIQELLRRSHRISYQYKFNWETWTRKDVS